MPTATISIDMHTAAVRGVTVASVRNALSATRHDAQVANGQVRVVPRNATFYRVDCNGAVTLAAGHVPRLRTALRAQGYVVQVQDDSVWPRLQAAQASVVPLNELQSLFLRWPRGQIGTYSVPQAADVFADAAYLYPDRQLLVACKNEETVEKLSARLLEIIPARLRLPGEAEMAEDNVVVATVAAAVSYGATSYALAFLVGVDTVLHARAERLLDEVLPRDAARYAIGLPGTRALTRYEELAVEARVGQLLYQICPASGPPQVLHVCWLPSTRLFRATAAQGWRRKRAKIWHSAARNQLIAEAAAAIAGNKHKRLVMLGCRGLVQQLVELPRPFRVAVLVEHRDHAAMLHQLLPDWNVLTAQSRPRAPLTRAIITEAYALEHGIAAEVVVRTMAGTSDLTLRAPKARETSVRLVLDVADPFSSAVEQRYLDYTQHGYRVEALPENPLGV